MKAWWDKSDGQKIAVIATDVLPPDFLMLVPEHRPEDWNHMTEAEQRVWLGKHSTCIWNVRP